MNVTNGESLLRKVNRFAKIVLKSVRNVMDVMNGEIFVKFVKNVINVINGENHLKKINEFVKWTRNVINVINGEDFLKKTHGFVDFVINYMIPVKIKLLIVLLDIHKRIVIIKP